MQYLNFKLATTQVIQSLNFRLVTKDCVERVFVRWIYRVALKRADFRMEDFIGLILCYLEDRRIGFHLGGVAWLFEGNMKVAQSECRLELITVMCR